MESKYQEALDRLCECNCDLIVHIQMEFFIKLLEARNVIMQYLVMDQYI